MIHDKGTGTYINRDATWGNGKVDGVCGDGIWDVGCGETKHVQKEMPGANMEVHT